MSLSPLRRLASQETILPSLIALAGAIALVTWLSPADKVLGDTVKLVYIHGAIIQVALITFYLAGLLGAGYLLAGRPALYGWSQALERTGLVLWVLYILTSAVTMSLAWGGIAWFEPRWVVGLQILVVAPLVHLAGVLMQNRRISAFLNVAMAGIIAVLLSQARLIMHPLNPVTASPTTSIKLFYFLLLGLWALTAVQLARGVRVKARLFTFLVFVVALTWTWAGRPEMANAERSSYLVPVPFPWPQPSMANASVRFAVIGDYGLAGQGELAVASLVKSWNPDFVITTGDNNYPGGAASTIDQNIGQYYHDFIYPYTDNYGMGATINRFFPSLGNHDWNAAGATPYLNYFALPGNERYYDFTWGLVHLFAVDSDLREPDGVSSSSRQAEWLRSSLAASGSCWNLVYFHHPPFSSGPHGSSSWMQWPYQAWGADAALSGHDHTYERILRDGLPYFVNGLGGSSRYAFGSSVSGSQVRYNANFGAMLVTATRATISYQFIAIDGTVVDTYSQSGRCTARPTRIIQPYVSMPHTWRESEQEVSIFRTGK